MSDGENGPGSIDLRRVAADLLALRMAPWQSLGVIGLANGFLGASAVTAGIRRARGRETVDAYGAS